MFNTFCFQKLKFHGVQRKWVATTVEVRGTLPGRGGQQQCAARRTWSKEGVEKLATSEEEVAGEKLLIKKERHALESE